MKKTPLQFCGRLLGSVVCSVLFAVAGCITCFFVGLWFPWSDGTTVQAPREEI